MKKSFALILGLLYFLVLANSAYATSLCPSNFSGLCTVDIGKAVGSFISLIYIVAIVAALLYLVWGGFKWLMSGGDKAALEQAREHVVAAIVGLIIIFLSYVILNFIAKFFLGSSFDIGNITLPTFGQ